MTTTFPLGYFSLMSISPTSLAAAGGSPYGPCSWPPREMKSDERGIYLIHLLLNCANYVAAGDLERANACLEHIALLGASPDGDTMQRIAPLFTDALARLLAGNLPRHHRRCRSGARPSLSPRPSRLRPPCTSRGATSSTAALPSSSRTSAPTRPSSKPWKGSASSISSTFTPTTRPHGSPSSRPSALAPRGPRTFASPASTSSRRSSTMRVSEEAEKLDVPFQFNPVISRLDCLDQERSLRVKTGEAVAVCSMLQLYRLLVPDDDSGLQLYCNAKVPSKCATSSVAQLHLMAQMSGHLGTLGELLDKEPHPLAPRGNGYSPRPDSGVSSVPVLHSARMEAFLSGLWALAPKVMLVVEQESNHNGVSLTELFTEALNYYAALFDCLESAAAASGGAAARVERVLDGDINNHGDSSYS